MDQAIIHQLSDINHQFYQSCARSFSQTRQRVQPGVRRILSSYLTPFDGSSLLDLGCGNGDLIQALDEASFAGMYTGLDFSAGLLQESNFQPTQFTPSFVEADITRQGWSGTLENKSFDLVLSFAVLHHIPGAVTRRQVMQEVYSILKPDGWFIFSVWQFLRSPRLAKRVQPWDLTNIDPGSLEAGDYLLDWRAEAESNRALRYVHVYTGDELSDLAQATGFDRVESFSSDGKEGNLSDYEVWRKHR